MLKTVIQKVLYQLLGKYINGIDYKNLEVKVWNGTVLIKFKLIIRYNFMIQHLNKMHLMICICRWKSNLVILET